MSVLVHLPAAAREHDHRGWIESWRSFPSRALARAGATRSPLFVIAEDLVAPGKGFGRHGHRDMEILSYVIAGGLAHADSTGRESVLHPGEFQVMSAGSGIEHSEYNASAEAPVRFLQIWVEPNTKALAPGYARIAFDAASPLVRLAAQRGSDATLHQAMEIWRVAPGDGETLKIPMQPGRTAWVHGVQGRGKIENVELSPGDGAGFTASSELAISGVKDAVQLVFLA